MIEALQKATSDPGALLQLVALLGVLLTIAVAALTAMIVARSVRPVPVSGPSTSRAAGDDSAALIAAISAAAYATVGAHRLVYVGETVHSSWTTEARQRHHSSHSPHA